MSNDEKENKSQPSFSIEDIKNAVEEANKEVINNLKEKIETLETRLNETPKEVDSEIIDPIVEDDNSSVIEKQNIKLKAIENELKLNTLTGVVNHAVENKYIKDVNKAIKDLKDSKLTQLYLDGRIGNKEVTTYLKGTDNKPEVATEPAGTETIAGTSAQETPGQVSEKEQKAFLDALNKEADKAYQRNKS